MVDDGLNLHCPISVPAIAVIESEMMKADNFALAVEYW